MIFLVNPREFLIHLKVEIRIQTEDNFEKELYKAYLKAKFNLESLEMFEEIEDSVYPFNYYEMTYFNKIKSDKYKHMLKLAAADIINQVNYNKEKSTSAYYKKSN
jgi:hypothetical protein